MVRSSQLGGMPGAEDAKDGAQTLFVVWAAALGLSWVGLFAVGAFSDLLTTIELIGAGAALLVMTDVCGFAWLMRAHDLHRTNQKREMRRELAFIRAELLRELRVQVRFLGDEVLKPTFELGRAHERFTGDLPRVTAIGVVPRTSTVKPSHLQSVKG
jgi:hypothetical protein